jgi:hypothetical protein
MAERLFDPSVQGHSPSQISELTEESKEPHKPQPTETLLKPQRCESPVFLYSCEFDTNKLHKLNLLTGEEFCHEVPNYEFSKFFRWSDLPGGSLLITGGYPEVREVVEIDPLRECAVSSQPPMRTGRCCHAALYHSQYVYVLGGYTGSQFLSECERFVCAESRWEVLPALPVAGGGMSAVELENSLYALGGQNENIDTDTVQKLSLDSLTWELMQIRLPQAGNSILWFKADDAKVYLVLEETLYSFTPQQVKPIKTLAEAVGQVFTSYFRRGTLYYSFDTSIKSLAVGELTEA